MVFDNVVKYCNRHDMTIQMFEELCGIGNGTVGRWRFGKSQPSMKTLRKMTKSTGTTYSFWLRED